METTNKSKIQNASCLVPLTGASFASGGCFGRLSMTAVVGVAPVSINVCHPELHPDSSIGMQPKDLLLHEDACDGGTRFVLRTF